MEYLKYIFSLLSIVLFDWFGWVLFLWLGAYVWYHVHVKKKQGEFMGRVKWVYLEIK